MRKVKLIRNKKEKSIIDLYDYLLNGSQRREDRFAKGGYYIFEPRENLQTRGTINRTQFFEIIENEGLKSLIKMAGGLKSTTYMKRVSISRIISPENRLKTGVDRTIVDVNLNDLFSSVQILNY